MADALDFSANASPADALPDFSGMAHPVAGPTGDWTTDLPRRLGTAGTDALGAALSLPRSIAQGVDWLGSKVGVSPGIDAALASVQQPGGGQLFPDANTAREMAYNTTGATEYQPETLAGRMVQAGLAAAPFGLATGGLGAVAPTVAGGATAEAGKEIVPDHPVVGSLAGFLVGSHAASGALNAGAKTVGMLTGTAPTSSLFQAYERQGVPTNLAGDVTQEPGLQLAQSMAAKMPGGAAVIHSAVSDAQNAWQTAAEAAASKLGTAATHQEAGQALQSAAQNWLQDWKSQSSQKWQDFAKAVPGNTPIKVDGFQQALADVNQNFGGADKLAAALQPGLGSKLQEALQADVSPNGTLPWQAVQATRTRLGEMLEGGQPVADTAQSAIKRLYSSLSDDMRDGANAAGPQAAQAFNQANAYTAFGHNLIDDHLGPILNATNPESAAQYALAQARQGGSRLNAIDFALPGQAQNLGASVVRQAAENGTGALPTALNKLSPEAQSVLFQGAAPAVNDLNDISTAMRRTVQSTGNNSNTAAHSQNGLGRVMSAIEMGNVGAEMAGHMGRLAGVGMGLMAPNVVGKAASFVGANPLLARIYSTQMQPFTAPGILSRNALVDAAQPDRRSLLGAPNTLLPPSVAVPVGSAATIPTR